MGTRQLGILSGEGAAQLVNGQVCVHPRQQFPGVERLGAVDYVAKPFNAWELLARVNTHLTIDQLRRTLAGKNAELARAHELVRRVFGRYVSEEIAECLL